MSDRLTFSSLPPLQTRQALLLLDLQNDFVRESGRLHVSNTQDFVDQIPALAQSFRRLGDVIWVRSQYENPSPLFDQDHGGERIVLAAGSLDTKKVSKKRDRNTGLGACEDDDPEAFLSGPNPACRPQSTGEQFPAPIVAAIDPDQDIVVVKSDYSALRSSGLVLSLRSRLVTELYLCGSLSNVSVYATALDAARQGFTITLIEDCLGFRSFARHEEAIRRMADIMGANGITLQELIEEHEHHETASIANAPPTPSNHSRGVTPAGIEGVLDHLDVHGSPKFHRSSAPSMEPLLSTPDPSLALEPDNFEDEDGDLDILPSLMSKYGGYTRAVARTARENTTDSANGQDERRKPRIRMRRPKNPNDSPPVSRQGKPSRNTEAASQRTSSSNAPAVMSNRTSPTPAHTNSPPTPAPTPTATSLSTNAISDTQSSTVTRSKKKDIHDGTVGPGDKIGEGDSYIQFDVDLPLDAFYSLREEVQWQKMYHLSGQVPRLVAVQGEILPSGSIPIYRHPADESPPLLPFSPTADRIRKTVEKIIGHPLNHVLIQKYRGGSDNISEHSDKTLDIVRGSSICNVSLGAQRTMTLRTKPANKADHAGDGLNVNARQTQRIPMPHSSLFVLGEETNRRWLHGIRPDRRPASQKSREELEFNEERISLTFRHIGTFFRPSENTIWGQGAVSKDPDRPYPVIHCEPLNTDQLIHAFGQENRDPEFDWDRVYGAGFNIVNFVTTPVAKLIPSSDETADFSVRLCMTENGMRYVAMDAISVSSLTRLTVEKHRKDPVYVDPEGNVAITGAAEILKYLAQAPPNAARPGVDVLRGGSRLDRIAELRSLWDQQRSHEQGLEEFFAALLHWNEILKHGQHYLDGPTLGIDDCALWPALREIMRGQRGLISSNRTPLLYAYYQRIEKRGCVKVVREEIEEPSEDE